MKRFNSFLALLPFLALPFLFSCNDDDGGDEAPEATATVVSNFPKGVVSVNYSVQVVVGNPAADGKVGGVANANVYLTQGGSTEIQLTADESGIVNFSGLAPGTVNGYVDAPGYTNVTFSAEIANEQLNTDSSQVRYAASTITVFEENSSLRGRIYGDYLQFNSPPNFQAPSSYEPTDVSVTYTIMNYPMGAGSGKLINATVDLNTITKTATAGRIVMDNLPGVVPGLLEAEMTHTDIVIDNIDASLFPVSYNIDPIANQPGRSLAKMRPGTELNLGYMEAKRKP
jgi:hypothetical protein